jgi:hypothetical protein
MGRVEYSTGDVCIDHVFASRTSGVLPEPRCELSMPRHQRPHPVGSARGVLAASVTASAGVRRGGSAGRVADSSGHQICLIRAPDHAGCLDC